MSQFRTLRTMQASRQPEWARSRGLFGQFQMTSLPGNSVASKHWPADDADSTADKIRIRMDFEFDPGFIGVEFCVLCGPTGVLSGREWLAAVSVLLRRRSCGRRGQLICRLRSE